MKKIIVLLMVVFLFACSAKSNEQDKSNNKPKEEQIIEKQNEKPKETKAEEENENSGIRPEFKAQIDSLEEYFNKYIEFMISYKESENTMALIGEYAEFMTSYVENMNKLEKLKTDDISSEELEYYLSVLNRINEKLLAVGQ